MSDIAAVIEHSGAVNHDGRNGKVDGKLIAQPDQSHSQHGVGSKACGKNLPAEILPHIGINAAQLGIHTGKDPHGYIGRKTGRKHDAAENAHGDADHQPDQSN